MSRYFDDSIRHDSIDDGSESLSHYGRKGMKWGKNIFDTNESVSSGSVSERGRKSRQRADKAFQNGFSGIGGANGRQYEVGGYAFIGKGKPGANKDGYGYVNAHTTAQAKANANKNSAESQKRQAEKEKILKDFFAVDNESRMKYINQLSDEDAAMLLSVLERSSLKERQDAAYATKTHENRPRARLKNKHTFLGYGKGVSVHK